MVLNSSEVQKCLTGKVDPSQVQQHGVDLTLLSICDLTGGEIYKENVRIGRENALLPVRDTLTGKETYRLEQGYYAVYFEQGVKIPANIKANIIQRSSLARSGAQISSSEYDPGFETANLGAYLTVYKPIIIERGARVAQIVMAETNPVDSPYDGQYQGK